MKITIIFGPFLGTPPNSAGAVEKVWWSLRSSFEEAGHEVLVIRRWEKGQSKAEGIKDISFFQRPRSIWFALLLDFAYSLISLSRSGKTDMIISNTLVMSIVVSNWTKASLRCCSTIFNHI